MTLVYDFTLPNRKGNTIMCRSFLSASSSGSSAHLKDVTVGSLTLPVTSDLDAEAGGVWQGYVLDLIPFCINLMFI